MFFPNRTRNILLLNNMFNNKQIKFLNNMFNNMLTDEDPGLRGVSTNKTIIYFINLSPCKHTKNLILLLVQI